MKTKLGWQCQAQRGTKQAVCDSTDCTSMPLWYFVDFTLLNTLHILACPLNTSSACLVFLVYSHTLSYLWFLPSLSKHQETLLLFDRRFLIALSFFFPTTLPLLFPSLPPPSLSHCLSLSLSLEVWLPAQPGSLFCRPEASCVSVPEGQHWQAAPASQEGAFRSSFWAGMTHGRTHLGSISSVISGERWITKHMNTWGCTYLCMVLSQLLLEHHILPIKHSVSSKEHFTAALQSSLGHLALTFHFDPDLYLAVFFNSCKAAVESQIRTV